ncbi:hypothetical protein Tco_1154343 [Tanacetum coccineum]
MTHHKRIFVSPSHTKKIFANMKREGKGFSGAITPLFDTMRVQATEDLGKGSELPTDTHPTPIITQPSSSKTQKKHNVLDLEEVKTAQAKEIVSLKKRVKKLERKQRSRTSGLKRLKKVGTYSRVESSKDKDSLGHQEDASKQGRSAKVAEREVSIVDPVTTTGEVVTTANVRVTTISAPTTTIDEMTLAQTLIAIKAAKPKAITTAATTVTAAITRPKEKGIVIQESKETTTTPSTKPSISSKDKGKGIMVEDPLLMKRKDQIKFDEEVARELEAKLKAEMEEEDRAARLKEEEANIALIESWENTQAMIEADYELAKSLQAQEQGELTIKEKSKLFVELMKKRKKHFAELRAQEKRNNPPTKAQKRNQMSTYLKHMGGYKYTHLKGKTYEEIEKLFKIEMKKVNSFIPMYSEVEKSSKLKAQESSVKRAGAELEQEKTKKQKSDEHEEVEVNDEVELKKHMEIVRDDDVAIDAIPLATKPPVIVEYKIVKEGIFRYF